MFRVLLNRAGTLAVILAVLGLASLTTSCGSGSTAAQPMVLLEFLFVDRALNPTAPTGTENLPRNAQILLVFSELVDPGSVTNQSIQIRFGPQSQSVPKGSFSVDGNTVRFDPTVTAQGQPNPFGFLPVRQYIVDIPNFEEQTDVVRNLDDDPNLETFFSTFVTDSGYLRELQPPEIVRVYSIPDAFEVNPITGQWPGGGIMAFEFSEPMDPSSFVLGGPDGIDDDTSIDVRYLPGYPVNEDNDLVNPDTGVGLPVAGYFTWDAAATTYFFNPTFSFGDKKYVFASRVFQGLKDLSGNLLLNSRDFGPFTCDGEGIETGKTLPETFVDTDDMDPLWSLTADWGYTDRGTLIGAPITSREAYVYTHELPVTGAWGEYFPIISPFAGAALNQLPGFSPLVPTSAGRRVMWAFSDDEMGPDGSVVGAGWGPDSNATFAAIYPTIVMRCGFQKLNTMNLTASFSGNYEGTPTVVYKGSYQVPQAANVGNTVTVTDPGGYPVGARNTCILPACFPVCTPLSPLYDYTGFQAFPEFSTFFEWSEGDPLVHNDRVFIFDASVQEGDTWQQLRGWFAFEYPCSWGLATGFPSRRLYGTYEDDDPNPPTSFSLGIFNPEPSLTDTSFTIVKRITLAQSLFFTDGFQAVGNSSATTFGKFSDYRPSQLTPQVQQGGALVTIQFQACDLIEARDKINRGEPYMPDWSTNIDDCDGYKCIRWRLHLISNLISETRASLSSVVIPVAQFDTPVIN